MYLENVKVDFVACYQIAGKKKNDPPKKHETSFGTFVLEYYGASGALKLERFVK